jgi:type IV pilus assembly protein PilN
MRQVGSKVTLIGYAQSNARVSTLMRNIDSSPWLTQPELVEIKAVPSADQQGPPHQRVHAQRPGEEGSAAGRAEGAPPAASWRCTGRHCAGRAGKG